jgi:hypothetical protein
MLVGNTVYSSRLKPTIKQNKVLETNVPVPSTVTFADPIVKDKVLFFAFAF